jgi:hypothetical protein
MTPRQYKMLRLLEHQALTPFEAGKYNQTTFRSLLIHEWIYFKGSKFVISRKGSEFFYDFHHANIKRKHPSLRLTAYFDPKIYHLRKTA